MTMVSRQDEHIGLLDVEEDTHAVVLMEDATQPEHYPKGTFRKIVSGMVTLIVLAVVTYVAPGLHWAQPWTSNDPVPFWNVVGRELLGEGARVEARAQELAETQKMARDLERGEDQAVAEPTVRDIQDGDPLPPYAAHPDDAEPVEQSIEDPTGQALDPFYRQLARTDAGYPGAITRVAHWGDSAIGADGITAGVRHPMQRRFGDAGHGFHLLQPPSQSYRHEGIWFRANGKWRSCFIIVRCRDDGHYGLGGVTYDAPAGAESMFGTARSGAFGLRASRIELWYAARPNGGRIGITVDGGESVVVETAADELEDRWAVVAVPDGPHEVAIRTMQGGRSRAYGVVLERGGPGIVWDGLSLIGAFTNRMLAHDRAHLHGQIRRRDPQLVVLMFGGNDMQRRITMEQYAREYADVIDLVRSAKPELACLVMSPVDHGIRKGNRVVTNPIVPTMVDAQRRVALEHGCAFFATYQAMGGEGSMGRWRRAEPPLASPDLAHLNRAGRKVVGAMLYRALMEGYVAYRKRVG